MTQEVPWPKNLGVYGDAVMHIRMVDRAELEARYWQMDDKPMAIAMKPPGQWTDDDMWAARIRGALTDRNYVPHREAALGVLLRHRADCGCPVPEQYRQLPYCWWAGAAMRTMAQSIGTTMRAFWPKWLQEWA